MGARRPKGIGRRDFLKIAGLCAVAGVVPGCPGGDSSSSPDGTVSPQRLEREFDLTAVTARTFATFIDHRDAPLGRKELARRLGISSNTLKDHITRIIRHVRAAGHSGVATLNDAVDVALSL